MMRSNHRVVVTRHGPPGVLQVVEEPLPEPGPDQVRVATQVAGVSGYDLMFRRSGRLPGTPRAPFTLGADLVGTVDAVGDRVSSVQVGQQVTGSAFSNGARGCYAEYVCLPEQELVPVPAGLDPAQVVCLPVNYLTAHAMMHHVARVQAGERALVQGAAGGVGSALVDLARLADLDTYGTASTHNLPFVEGFGATAIDYRTEDVVARIRTLTGDGVDVAFDPVGGARQIRRSYQTLRRGGRLVWFGMAGTRDRGLRIIPSTLAMRTLLAMLPDGRHAPLTPDLTKLGDAWYRDTLSELLGLLAEGRISPAVAERVPLPDAARAHALLERGGHAGKIVLVTGARKQA